MYTHVHFLPAERRIEFFFPIDVCVLGRARVQKGGVGSADDRGREQSQTAFAVREFGAIPSHGSRYTPLFESQLDTSRSTCVFCSSSLSFYFFPSSFSHLRLRVSALSIFPTIFTTPAERLCNRHSRIIHRVSMYTCTCFVNRAFPLNERIKHPIFSKRLDLRGRNWWVIYCARRTCVIPDEI